MSMHALATTSIRTRHLGGLALAPLVALSACTTTLATRPLSQGGTSAAVGIPYALPALRYELRVTRTLTACELAADGRPDVVFEVAVEAKPDYVAGERFVADYRELASWSKTSAIKVETYPNRTLKSVNVEAQDKSAEIAAGVIKAGFSIASLAVGLPPAAALTAEGKVKRPTPYSCPAALAQIDQLKPRTEALTAQLTALTKQLDPYLVPSLLGALTEADKAKISQLRGDIGKAADELAAIQAAVAKLRKGLTFDEAIWLRPTTHAPDAVFAFPSGKPEIEDAQLAWLSNMFGGEIDPAQARRIGADMKPVVAALRAAEGMAPNATDCADAGLDAGCVSTAPPEWRAKANRPAGQRPLAVPGIAFREPVDVRLRICRDDDATRCAEGLTPPIVEQDVLAPQLGRLVILPFRNGFGANNKLEAHFRSDGSMEWAGYDEKAAAGVAAIDLVNGALDQGLTFAEARRAKKLADRTEAQAAAAAAAAEPAAELDRQIALLTKQQALLKLQTPPNEAELAAEARARQQAELDAEVARLTALKAIHDLEAALAS